MAAAICSGFLSGKNVLHKRGGAAEEQQIPATSRDANYTNIFLLFFFCCFVREFYDRVLQILLTKRVAVSVSNELMTKVVSRKLLLAA